MTGSESHSERYDLVVVSNRLPVDHVVAPDGTSEWRRSPGGLVTALEPVMHANGGVWIGWAGSPDVGEEPFELDGLHIQPVSLSSDDVEHYYEGFSNDTIWPLYHDVISPPSYHREWWDRYVTVNRRFAEAAADRAADGATVWVHDYQLQLVPRMLRELRPDLAIGFFDHIPFPPYGIFAQLPWRVQVIDGLLGADVIGFQRVRDAANFAESVRRLNGANTRAIHRGSEIEVVDGGGRRRVIAKSFPISIDTASFERLARTPEVQERAREIRKGLGDPKCIILGVDRLDYTKGIAHRLKAFGELLEDGELSADDVTLVQVASPSRERVEAYVQLRDEIELMVGRINGDYSTLGHPAINYHHHGYPQEEMAALYVAADVMLVTALRDGMNLVAKEYVASRFDEDGVLVLSEFTGAADELRRAVLVNPHDIDGLKEGILEAVRMPRQERRKRMRAMRRRVAEHDVARWSQEFLETLAHIAHARSAQTEEQWRPGASLRSDFSARPTRGTIDVEAPLPYTTLPDSLIEALRELARQPRLLVTLDFDGTLAPEVDDPDTARALPEAREAVLRLAALPGTRVALMSGRALASLDAVAGFPPDVLLVGSHGAEFRLDNENVLAQLGPDDEADLATLERILDRIAGEHERVWVERKPVGFALHTRLADEENSRVARLLALGEVGAALDPEDVKIREGKNVLEFSIRGSTKGEALEHLRNYTRAGAVFFAGDDVTDEDAFAALGPEDVGLKSGPGVTLANFRVPGPAEVALVLARLAECREQEGPPPVD